MRGRARPAVAGLSLAAVLGAAHGAADIPYGAFSALLPTTQVRFGLEASLVAVLAATLSFSASLAQPLFGALADRIGRRRVVVAGVVISSAMLSLVALVPTLWLVAGLLVVGGLASAAFHPAAAGLARRSGASNESLAVSIVAAGGTLGVAIGPVLVLLIMRNVGVAATPWLMVPGVALGAIAYIVVPDEPPVARSRPPLLDAQLLFGPAGGLVAAAVLAALPAIAFGAGFPLWLVQERGLAADSSVIGWTLASYSLAAVLGGLSAGALAHRVNPTAVIGGTMIASLLPFVAVFAVEPGTVPYFLAVMAAGGLLSASTPLLVVNVQDMVPRSIGAASGMMSGFAHGLAAVLYIGVGTLQDLAGIGPALVVTYLLLVPAGVLAVIVLRRAAGAATQPTADCTCRVCRCSIPGMCGCVAGDLGRV
jgi:FSR family fosmidomycin resistance protein-like MFS transporter